MKNPTASDPATLAQQIWNCGVAAVRSDQVVWSNLLVEHGSLRIGSQEFDLNKLGSICVVGAGKAGAGMASGLEQALGDELLAKTTGWVNVPEGCERELKKIHLHPARPAGRNEPTAAGVSGTRKILQLVRNLDRDDLCICLLSGGGSALLPSPKQGVTLRDKLRVTKLLSGAGANINQLNAVRKQLSDVKAGGLARACTASNLVTMIISDVIGDPLDVIASGPTVINPASDVSATEVIDGFINDPEENRYFQRLLASTPSTSSDEPTCNVSNFVVANNQTAVDAAVQEATRIGCATTVIAPESSNTTAEAMGEILSERIHQQLQTPTDRPLCIVSGGEPVVRLAPPSERGKGGRNQQLVLSALTHLLRQIDRSATNRFALLSAGTDGEDGPTDAAGALVGPLIDWNRISDTTDLRSYLNRNDAYSFFDRVGGLIKTGPTHTNVCDLRVAIIFPS